jgi:hypothetical protein
MHNCRNCCYGLKEPRRLSLKQKLIKQKIQKTLETEYAKLFANPYTAAKEVLSMKLYSQEQTEN